MTKRPAQSNPAQVAAILRGFRFNSVTLTVLAMVVIGVMTLAPRVQTWFEQRQAIAEARAALEAAKSEVAQMQVERKRWEDPAYIKSQARDRLYYVMPGEVSFLVMDADGVDTSDVSGTVGALLAEQKNNAEISADITQTRDNWVDALLETVIRAGIEQPAEETSEK